MYAKLREHFLYALVGGLALFCMAIWGAVCAQTPRGVLTLAALNVGQGDSLYIEGPTGLQMLIDAGPGGGAVVRELSRVMPRHDRSLDAVVATHPDADHIGGFKEVLARYKVEKLIEPGIRDDTQTSRTLEQEVEVQHIPRYLARRGQWVDLGGGARLRILYPDTDVSAYTKKTNDGSIVAHLLYGATSVLLTGDMPEHIEEHLLRVAGAPELKSDILKVGHHGSKYSTSEEFLYEVDPQIAIISVGARNTYGHPSARVVDLLSSQHITTLRTDEVGTIVFQSDGIRVIRVR